MHEALRQWHLPAHFNGLGMHFLPFRAGADAVREQAPRIRAAGCTLVLHLEEDVAAIQAFADTGLYQVVRPALTGDEYVPADRMDRLVRALLAAQGAAPIQLGNEPNEPVERFASVRRYVDWWVRLAAIVKASGGIPLLAPVPGEWLPEIAYRLHTANATGFVGGYVDHSYWHGRRFDYPLYLGRTLDADHTCYLGAYWFHQRWEALLGRRIPVVTGECGDYLYEDVWESRYAGLPRTDGPPWPRERLSLYANRVAEVCGHYRRAELPGVGAMPDTLVGFCLWLWADGRPNSPWSRHALVPDMAPVVERLGVEAQFRREWREVSAVNDRYPGNSRFEAVPHYTQGTSCGRRWRENVDTIVMHHTAGTWQSALAAWRGAREASAHFIICQDGTVLQCVELNDVAWHADVWSWNVRSVGIEHEHYRRADGSWTEWTDVQLAASARLLSWLKARMGGWQVKRHRDVAATECPGDLPVERILSMMEGTTVSVGFDERFRRWFGSAGPHIAVNEQAGIFQTVKARIRSGERLGPPVTNETDDPVDANLTVQFGVNWKATYNKTTHDTRMEVI